MALRRFLLALTILLTLTIVVVVWLFPSNEDFRAENRFWNGVDNLVTENGIKPVESLAALPAAPEGATLILVPYLEFTETELDAVRSFTDGGGTLVLADDYGQGNQVLEYLELASRFSRQTLLDPLSNYNSKRLPRILHFTDNFLTNHIDSLVFNHATTLLNVDDDDLIARSSLFSFLDLNDDGNWNENEPTGRMPVISRHETVHGQVILIADSSVFINSMTGIAGNRRLLENIMTISPAGLYFDQSHLPPSNLHTAKIKLAELRSLLASPLGLLLLIVLALALTLFPLWRRQPHSLERSLS